MHDMRLVAGPFGQSAHLYYRDVTLQMILGIKSLGLVTHLCMFGVKQKRNNTPENTIQQYIYNPVFFC